jgi:hypothetical protein
MEMLLMEKVFLMLREPIKTKKQLFALLAKTKFNTMIKTFHPECFTKLFVQTANVLLSCIKNKGSVILIDRAFYIIYTTTNWRCHMKKIKYGCIILLMFITILSMFSTTVYANAMDDISLKTTSPIPDDPDTPFIEQYVHNRLQKEYSDLMELDFYWNTISTDVCQYAHFMWVGKVNDGFQITIYISHELPIGALSDEDGELIVDGPCFGFESPWDRFVYEIEPIKQFFKANPGAFVMFLILVVCFQIS